MNEKNKKVVKIWIFIWVCILFTFSFNSFGPAQDEKPLTHDTPTFSGRVTQDKKLLIHDTPTFSGKVMSSPEGVEPLTTSCSNGFNTLPHTTSCVPFTAGCAGDVVEPFTMPCDPDGVEAFTMSCQEELHNRIGPKPSATEVAQSYNSEELRTFSFVQKKNIIVSYDNPTKIYGYKTYFLHREEALVFVNYKNPIRNISSQKLYHILTGKLKVWNALGWNKSPIQVYLHNGVHQKRKFELLLKRAGINQKQLLSTKPIYLNEYDMLAKAAAKDKYSIVFGLKNKGHLYVKLITIDNVTPLVGKKIYPKWLTMNVFLYSKATDESDILLRNYISSIYKY